jgi:hypothetical protein
VEGWNMSRASYQKYLTACDLGGYVLSREGKHEKIDDLFDRALSKPLPVEAERLKDRYGDDVPLEAHPMGRLIKLCRELQEDAGSKPFPLSVRLAAELLEVNAHYASLLLGVLMREGLLTRLSAGRGNKPARYQYNYERSTAEIFEEWAADVMKPSNFTSCVIASPDVSTLSAITFADLVALEPRLDDLMHEARMHHATMDETFCCSAAWYGFGGYPGIKPRLVKLVGYERPGSHPILKTEQAYDVAYSAISEALPDCQDCAC